MSTVHHRIPGVLFRSHPRHAEVPLIFDSPHSGTDYPAAPDRGATLIGALFPRSYIDTNRHVADIDQALLAEPWPHPLNPGVKTKLGMGLIRRLAVPKMPVYGRKLGIAEVQGRMKRYYRA